VLTLEIEAEHPQDDDRQEESTVAAPLRRRGPGSRGPKPKPHVPVDGDVLKWFGEIAANLGISERTLKRMNVERTRIGGVLYGSEKAIARAIADSMTKPRARRRRW
jgi:hypothetical protein